MQLQTLKNILEALLLSADKPMDLRRLEALFEADQDRPSKDDIRQALQALQDDYQDRGIQLKEVASGYRMQVVEDYAPWVARLWEEKPPRYSRALLETLVLIAYRQPITRGEIEDIRGVSVSSHIIKTLLEREWVRVLGHKDVPGKPAMYGTTREFLDYFSLKSLDELPPLSEIKDLDKLHPELALDDSAEGDQAAGETDAEPQAEAAEGAHQAGDETALDSAAEGADDTPVDEAERDEIDEMDEMDADDAAEDDREPITGEAQTPASGADDQDDADETATGQQPDTTAEDREPAPAEAGQQGEEARPEGVSEDDPNAEREMQTG